MSAFLHTSDSLNPNTASALSHTWVVCTQSRSTVPCVWTRLGHLVDKLSFHIYPSSLFHCRERGSRSNCFSQGGLPSHDSTIPSIEDATMSLSQSVQQFPARFPMILAACPKVRTLHRTFPQDKRMPSPISLLQDGCITNDRTPSPQSPPC